MLVICVANDFGLYEGEEIEEQMFKLAQIYNRILNVHSALLSHFIKPLLYDGFHFAPTFILLP